jgi:hypothetical protein
VLLDLAMCRLGRQHFDIAALVIVEDDLEQPRRLRQNPVGEPKTRLPYLMRFAIAGISRARTRHQSIASSARRSSRWPISSPPRRRCFVLTSSLVWRGVSVPESRHGSRARVVVVRARRAPSRRSTLSSFDSQCPRARNARTRSVFLSPSAFTSAFRIQHCDYDRDVKHRDAVDMLRPADLGSLGPTTWADLGCGEGTFTLALCDLLAPGSTVHAVDVDDAALARIPSCRGRVHLSTHALDFSSTSWPFGPLDGILMANSLHYVADQPAFIARCSAHLVAPRRFLIVEYDTETSSPWVPFPVSFGSLGRVFPGFSVRMLDVRPSVFRRARLYSVLVWDNRAVGA